MYKCNTIGSFIKMSVKRAKFLREKFNHQELGYFIHLEHYLNVCNGFPDDFMEIPNNEFSRKKLNKVLLKLIPYFHLMCHSKGAKEFYLTFF